MKKLIILLGILLPCTVASASVEGIKILSQEHHVSGYAAGTGETTSYDQTEPFPLSGTASAFWPGQNSGINAVNSSAGNFSVTTADLSRWTFTESWAIAESTYIFSPLTAHLQFQYSGSVEPHAFENKIWLSIYDITDSLFVDDRKWSTESPIGISFIEYTNYTFDPSHQYELQLYAAVFAGDNPGVTSSLDVSIIPEPCSLLLLGLGSLVFRKREA